RDAAALTPPAEAPSAIRLPIERGALLPALLDGASFQGNTFDGVEIPALIFAECGSLVFEDNTVKDCYSGLWIIGRRSLPEPTAETWEPPLDVYQDPLLESALALAQLFPLPPSQTLPVVKVPVAVLPFGLPPFSNRLLRVMNALLRFELSL